MGTGMVPLISHVIVATAMAGRNSGILRRPGVTTDYTILLKKEGWT